MRPAEEILLHLPYLPPYRYVDEITFVSENRAEGHYTFRKDEFFYQGHFAGHPVTPGLILVECMGQIGLVAMAMYLYPERRFTPLLTSVEAEFMLPVYPGEKVFVESEKLYSRGGVLKCMIRMFNADRQEVAHTTAILKIETDE